MEKRANIFVISAPEISGILLQEIKDLGFKDTTEHRLGVQLKGTLANCMYLNLHLRTANKVLWEAGRFFAKTPNHLYQNAKKISWEDEIPVNGYFNIDSYVKNDSITDTRFANLKLKDAIVDRFVEQKGRRPNTGPEKDKIRIYMHWTDTDCIVYYDTSGGVIAKHGYRKIPGKAPMIESLAAAVIIKTKWDRKSPFINPMCGSGTLAIEAALLASNTAPGLFRKNFSFMHLNSFNRAKWDQQLQAAKDDISKPLGKIYASDLSEDAVNITKINAQAAGMENYINFEQKDFRNIEVTPQAGIAILNPEYGERLGEEEQLKEIYTAIGDFLKNKCQGYTGYIFTGNRELAKVVGLRTKRKIPFYNGSIECRLLEYELYQGTKKNS